MVLGLLVQKWHIVYDIFVLFFIALATGMRQGGLLGLRLKDNNKFKKGIITCINISKAKEI
ncbi:hypothetical protein BW892_27095 [Bacillus cereus]|uniref:Uncharacterized protein n=1 Tax=Bacillus cereus TaxID=1396 RepID=A0A1S9U6P4_BACCE|nr:hypothetical protein BW892_27095 [Bacillus cereus]